MTYQGLLLEFSDVFLYGLDSFDGLSESKMQELADGINSIFFLYLNDMEMEALWNSFISFLIKICQENPEIRIDVNNFKDVFIDTYKNASGWNSDDEIADMVIKKLIETS